MNFAYVLRNTRPIAK